MSYVNIFGGTTIQPVYNSYFNLTSALFTENLTLSWPTQYQDTQFIVSAAMDISASTSGLSLIMPDASQTSVGQIVTFNNYGSFAVSIKNHSGGVITNINAGNTFQIWLIDNTTSAGTWRVFPYASGGGGVVTSVAAESETIPALTITGSPITTSGTFEFTLDTDLVALDSFAAGTGIAARTGVGTWALRSLTAGTGISLANGDGVSGNPQIAVDSTLNLTNLTVGNLNLTGNTISSTSGDIIVKPTAGQSLFLGASGASGIKIDPSNNLSNANNISAQNITANSSLNLTLAPEDPPTSNTAGVIARSWVVYNGNTQTVLNSFNVNTVTRIASGKYQVNLPAASSAPGANYCVVGLSTASSSMFVQNTSTSSYTLQMSNPVDATFYAVAFW